MVHTHVIGIVFCAAQESLQHYQSDLGDIFENVIRLGWYAHPLAAGNHVGLLSYGILAMTFHESLSTLPVIKHQINRVTNIAAVSFTGMIVRDEIKPRISGYILVCDQYCLGGA